MSTQIFVNLPVRDLDKAKAFFSALGYVSNPQFTDENAACVVISDSIYVMLLAEPFFRGFTRKSLCDTRTHTEVLLCLSVASRSEVDAMVAKALSAGGREQMEAKDYGFMYQRGFEDLDGHLWEVVHMDEARPSTD
ncbi:MAG: VOC family protein [Pseudoxanthomonas sp.]|jgi:predicted lactoylglutathione lyase|uniref:VOC family protein n=1 Tax=Pseudoxanthomonas TaxID=83618 RepID=UPI00138A524E|nr:MULTISPECIES: VOC family protein [Pseudoxanthomonas]KAF1729274.1 glyoxalase/bleomycin resistance/extradiol dioxygenase family protein [Pseudoxanthomonas mexicana]MCH2092206.1 VOC family protein [Pseudoxanthomonas sp.]